MTRENLIRWTCNMCKKTVDLADVGERPAGWVSYSLTDVGDSGPLIPLGHLCDNCRDEVQGLINVKADNRTTGGGTITVGGFDILKPAFETQVHDGSADYR